MPSHAYFFTRFDVYPYHYVQLKKIGFNIKNVLVIEKGHIGGGGDLDGGFANNCEWLIFCHKGRRVFNKTKLMKNTKPVGKKQQGIIIQHRNTKQDLIVVGLVIDTLKALIIHRGKKKNNMFHPTIKNVECIKWLIQISSNYGDLILDPFMGSGSTAVACMLTERNFIGFEISGDYCRIAERRLAQQSQIII